MLKSYKWMGWMGWMEISVREAVNAIQVTKLWTLSVPPFREGLTHQALSKSWHCQDWLNPTPPPPNPGTLVDLATKSA